MRFMIIVKATKDSEAGVMPSDQLIAQMATYHEELAKAGVLLDASGLQASSKGWARLSRRGAASEEEVDRARAERDVALAQMARTKAIIAKKTVRAPFRARVGLADVHPGQYLEEGTLLTTLQGVDDAVHVDFTVAQQVASALREGENVEVFAANDAPPIAAQIVASCTPRARRAGSGHS